MFKEIIGYITSIYKDIFSDSDKSFFQESLPYLPSVVAFLLLALWFLLKRYISILDTWDLYMYLVFFLLLGLNGVTNMWTGKALVFLRGVPAVIYGFIMFVGGFYVAIYIIMHIFSH